MGVPKRQVRNDASFDRLYRRHRRDVYGAVLRDVRNPEEAEDVTQIAFLNAFRAMQRGEEPEKPRAWLVTIARNVIRRRYRELARRPQEVALDPEVAATLLEVDGPTAGEIMDAVRRLPPNQRAVILLREIQGRSYAEIAEELGLSLPAVETLIFRARRGLSEELELADRAPTTQQRRTRSLGLLPLPGLGKLSLGFSAARMAAAVVLGSVAIVAVPVRDGGAEKAPVSKEQEALAPTLDLSPPFASPTAAAPVEDDGVRPARKVHAAKPTKAKEDVERSDEDASVVPALPLPSEELPSTDDVSVPTITLEPAPLPVEPLPLPDDPIEVPDLPELPPLLDDG